MALSSAEARALVQFGRDERLRLEKIRDDFKEKGSWGLRWDSCVSSDERRSWWYLYLFTFRGSNKTEVIREIEKYIKLYENIENIQSLTFEQIEAMEEGVKQAFTEAKAKLGSIDSSTVYKMCRDFLSSKIDKDIEKIKNAVGAQEYKKLKNDFEKLVKEESEKLKKEYQTKLDDLTENNKKQAEEHAQTVQTLQEGIEAANSRFKGMEKALLCVGSYMARKDEEFALELQQMMLENRTIREPESLIAVEYPTAHSSESETK